jgi:3-oxoacyl-[acyl-carrier-protein] synthase-3
MADDAGRVSPCILGTGRNVPERILTNADLEKIVDTTDEWIIERTGIRERHITTAAEANSDVAYPAAVRALEDAGLAAADLDAIICATVTPDNPFPAVACKLQALLGADNAFAFDVSAACSGWIYSLELAHGLMQTGSARHILVMGTEMLTKIVDWTERTTCVLFGDGSGAAVLGPSQGSCGLLSCRLATDGRHYDLLVQPAGGSRLPPSHETVEHHQHAITMLGREVFKHAVRNMARLSLEVIEEAGLTVADVDVLIPHQANHRIITETGRRIGIDPEKVYINVDRYGNTSAASIPIALDEVRRNGQVGPGSIVCVVAFGGGFTYGAAVLRL